MYQLGQSDCTCGGGGGFFLACEDFGRMSHRPFIPCMRFCLFVFSWRLGREHLFNSLHQDQSTVAQRAETTMAKCPLTSCVWACFRIGFLTLPGQRHSQPTPTSLGREYACLGVTCHPHVWQNDRGLIRATAVKRGWCGHRIRVSTQS